MIYQMKSESLCKKQLIWLDSILPVVSEKLAVIGDSVDHGVVIDYSSNIVNT